MIGGLPRRDLWLLPLISLLTVFAMLVGAEALARIAWPEQIVNACIVSDSTLKSRYKSNCSSVMKSAEGPWYRNQYNDCGYRSAASCAPVPAGTRRIALIGASLAEGYLVEYPNSIGARLGDDLTAMCGAPVEVQNLGGATYRGRLVILRMQEALALRPNAVLFAQSPLDIELQLGEDNEPVTTSGVPGGGVPGGALLPAAAGAAPIGADGTEESLQRRLVKSLRESRAVTIAQHFLFQNLSVYLPLFLHYGDKADFLRPPFSATWQERLRRFDLLITDLAGQARRAGVPLTLVFVPQQAQLALMDGRPVPAGIDPDALPNALKAITARHGVDFIDSSETMRKQPQPNLLYYTVDGHPSGLGQPIIANAIARHYADTKDGPFADCRSFVAKRQTVASP